MKQSFLMIAAAMGLGACATASDKTVETEESMAPAMVCAVENPDGTCACEVVDENGDCVEGGGTGVIIP